MSPEPSARRTEPSTALLGALFLASGISGLVYEVVWMRMLIRSFGVTIYAVSTVLTVFMAGLAFGGIFVAPRAARRIEALRGYALAELGIGLTAALSTFLIARLPGLYAAAVSELGAVPVVLIRFTLAVIALGPPTILMGTTLPLASGYLERTGRAREEGAGILYGLNTFGAVVGVVASGFALLYWLGENGTVAVAVVINLAVGAFAWFVGRGRAHAPEDAPSPTPASPVERPVLIVYAVSGFCALAYQVIWSRMLNLILGNSVYGFSSMLAAYLVGLAVGSVVLAKRAAKLARPITVLGAMQVAVALLALISVHVYTALGTMNVGEDYAYSQIWKLEDFGRLGVGAALIVLPLTLVLGAMFPIVSRLATRGERAEDGIGRLYGYNTIGAIVGSFATGFVLVPTLGMHLSFLAVSVLSFALGGYLFFLAKKFGELPNHRPLLLGSGLVVTLVVSLTLQDPFLAVLVPRLQSNEHILRHEEAAAATVTATEDPSTKHLFINGLYVSTVAHEMGSILVHMPLTFHPDPKKVLVVGFGAGEAFRAGLDHGLETTVAELVPAVPEMFPLLHEDAAAYRSDPKAHVRFEDGRNYLLSTKERFDLVVVDVTPPAFSSGAVNVYSLEFVRLVADHLTEPGLFALWFPIPTFEDDFWMVARNFTDAFRHVALWARPGMTGIVLLGTNASEDSFQVTPEIITTRLARAKNVAPTINAMTVLGALMPDTARIQRFAQRGPNVTDTHPITEFPLHRFWNGETYHRNSEFLRAFAEDRLSSQRTATPR